LPSRPEESWVTTTISPKSIEVWWHGKWNPIQQAASWGWSDFEYQYSEDEGTYIDWEGAPVGEMSTDVETEAVESFSPKIAKVKFPATFEEWVKTHGGLEGFMRGQWEYYEGQASQLAEEDGKIAWQLSEDELNAYL